MNYEMTVEERSGYLYILLKGTAGQSNANLIVAEGIKTILELGCERALVDVRDLKLETSLVVDFNQARHLAQVLAGKTYKIAHLSVPEKLEADRFFETVGANRGLNIRVFVDEQAAIDWLMT